MVCTGHVINLTKTFKTSENKKTYKHQRSGDVFTTGYNPYQLNFVEVDGEIMTIKN